MIVLSTFSIVACDLKVGEWGIAVQSKFLAVGSAVPWAQAGVGAVATQSYVNTAYGPRGLALLKGGLSAQRTLDQLVADDADRALRQAGIVDASGRSATFTGDKCLDWAGGITSDGLACQGNILVSAETVKAMAEMFTKTRGKTLAVRLLASLRAGQAAGGDRRGKQSAALLVEGREVAMVDSTTATLIYVSTITQSQSRSWHESSSCISYISRPLSQRILFPATPRSRAPSRRHYQDSATMAKDLMVFGPPSWNKLCSTSAVPRIWRNS